MSGIADVLEGRARWVLIQGDCLAELQTIGDRSVAAVLTDPPYESEAHTLQRRIKSAGASWADGKDRRKVVAAPLGFAPLDPLHRRAIGAHLGRVACRWVVVFCQIEGAPRWRTGIVAGGSRYIRTAIWVKPNGQPQLSGDRPGMGYESLLVCHGPGRTRWNGGGRVGVFSHNTISTGSNAPPEATGHQTQKPLPLMLELVELFTDPDDLVLDPFAGSATTGVACLRLGRRFIGIEKDGGFAQVAQERLVAEGQGLTLRAARAGQMPLFAGGAK